MKKQLLLLLKSLHPAHSRQLSERLLTKAFSFYFLFIFVGLVIMLGVFVGLNWNKPFDIADLSTNDTIVLVDKPKVTVEPRLNETKAFLAFSQTELSYKKFIFFGKTTRAYENELTLLLLPGIVTLIGVISTGLGLIIALITSLVGYFTSRNDHTTFRDVLVINLHYQAPALLLFFILYPFWSYAFVVLLLYLFNFVLGVILLSSKKFKTLSL